MLVGEEVEEKALQPSYDFEAELFGTSFPNRQCVIYAISFSF